MNSIMAFTEDLTFKEI